MALIDFIKGENNKMSALQTITLDGVEYTKKQAPDLSDVRIVILQRGWVMVGQYKREGDNCSLTNASVIRIWGTTMGLGEIAKDGPTSSTKLEPCYGLVEFHRLTEVATIVAKADKWQQYLK